MAPAPSAPMPFSLSVFAGSLVWISLSYSGFNAAVYVAGEAKDAQRAAPRALVVGTLIVTVLYIALNAAFVYLPPLEAVVGQEAVAAAAAQAIGGAPAALAIRFVTVLALITSVFSLVMAGPRVYARMADDGVFPSFFRFGGAGAPTAAIMAQAGAGHPPHPRLGLARAAVVPGVHPVGERGPHRGVAVPDRQA